MNEAELVLAALEKLARYGYPVEEVRHYKARKLEVLAALINAPPEGQEFLRVLHLVTGTRREIHETIRALEAEGLIARNHVGQLIGKYTWRIRMEGEPQTAPLPIEEEDYDRFEDGTPTDLEEIQE